MATKADWFVVAGFLTALFGIALRIIIMMRASDARPADATPLAGGALLRDYRTSNPRSKLPILMWASIATGLVMLIAGFLLEMA